MENIGDYSTASASLQSAENESQYCETALHSRSNRFMISRNSTLFTVRLDYDVENQRTFLSDWFMISSTNTHTLFTIRLDYDIINKQQSTPDQTGSSQKNNTAVPRIHGSD